MQTTPMIEPQEAQQRKIHVISGYGVGAGNRANTGEERVGVEEIENDPSAASMRNTGGRTKSWSSGRSVTRSGGGLNMRGIKLHASLSPGNTR